MINYKNSSTYMQRQIYRILRKHYKYIRTYINDIIIFFKTVKKNIYHLIEIFNIFNVNNIIIKSEKVFFDYFIV